MAIQFSSNAPSDGLERIQMHLAQSEEYITNEGFRDLRGRVNIRVGQGIQTWTLGLEDAETGEVLSAEPGEWRYLIFEADDVISEIQLSGATEAEGITAAAHGPITSSLVTALELAGEIAELDGADFEPRLLLAPSLVFASLWLHNEEQDDIFIPIPPTALSLPNFERVSTEEVAEALREEARSVRMNIEEALGPSGGSGGGTRQSGEAGRAPGGLDIASLNLEPSVVSHTLAPSAGAAARNLPHFMQRQKQTNWCWSAVGTSVGLLFKTGKWTQCDTATGCLSGKNCCRNPGPCNVYGYLDEALRYTRSFQSMTSGTAALAKITSEINARHPVCTRVQWNGGGAHFMAITGYNGPTITIQDSIYGTSTMRYSKYPASYQGGGTWTHTYYCRP